MTYIKKKVKFRGNFNINKQNNVCVHVCECLRCMYSNTQYSLSCVRFHSYKNDGGCSKFSSENYSKQIIKCKQRTIINLNMSSYFCSNDIPNRALFVRRCLRMFGWASTRIYQRQQNRYK